MAALISGTLNYSCNPSSSISTPSQKTSLLFPNYSTLYRIPSSSRSNLPRKTLKFAHNSTSQFHQQFQPRISPILNGIDQQDEEVEDVGVKVALSMLNFYKAEISPLLPKSCRYVPTCSEYSMIAYKKYGVLKGTILTAWRICRCNPLGGSGFDPPRWFDEEPTAEE